MDEIVKPSEPLTLGPQDQAPKKQRHATPFQITIGCAVVLLSGLSVGFAAYQMHEASKTRNVLTEFQSTVYERCLARRILDQAAHDAVSSNAEFYATLEAIAADAPPRPGLDARTRVLIERQKQAIHKARVDAERVSAASLPGSCEQYRPDRR